MKGQTIVYKYVYRPLFLNKICYYFFVYTEKFFKIFCKCYKSEIRESFLFYLSIWSKT